VTDVIDGMKLVRKIGRDGRKGEGGLKSGPSESYAMPRLCRFQARNVKKEKKESECGRELSWNLIVCAKEESGNRDGGGRD
jgi:hypothetical protein